MVKDCLGDFPFSAPATTLCCRGGRGGGGWQNDLEHREAARGTAFNDFERFRTLCRARGGTGIVESRRWGGSSFPLRRISISNFCCVLRYFDLGRVSLAFGGFSI